jgi:hypothetical protein
MEMKPHHTRVPELYGDFWFNTEPVSLRAHQGQIILLDFWDYTSMSSLRTIPYVNLWHEKYEEFGMLVVGVHTPQFRFGRNPDHIERAIHALGIRYPVVMDNEGFLWNAFGARVWPTKFLVDRDGFIRFRHEGEGEYEQLERALQSLLAESGIHGVLPDLSVAIRETDEPGALCYRTTGDIFTGYAKGTIGNLEGSNPESTIEYNDQGIYLPGRLYLQGRWLMERECVRFEGSGVEPGALTLVYQALEVGAVCDAEIGRVHDLRIEQDGVSLSDENRGPDVDASSIVHVDAPRLYTIVRNKEFGEHRLRLTTASRHVRIYVFSFATSVIRTEKVGIVSRN